LGIAIWMLARFLPPTVILALWAVLVFMAGVFMGGLTTLRAEATLAQKLGKGFGSLAMIYGVLLVIGAATGGKSVLRPLEGIELAGGSGEASSSLHEQLPPQRVK
ncbi:MAG: thiol:disulfide interchange protein, partial [Desulfuromonadales bacterium]|nr:thiol:disulfide interchange protein [Desulfuromonadales bacterium]